MSSTAQINILVYFCIGAHYFGDPPYLESPSRRAVSQKTSCKRNKAMDLISISAFRKDSSLKYQRPSVRTPLQRQWKGIKGDWYNKQWGSAIRKHFCPIPLESNLFEYWIYVSFFLYYILIDIYHYLLNCECLCKHANIFTQTYRNSPLHLFHPFHFSLLKF